MPEFVSYPPPGRFAADLPRNGGGVTRGGRRSFGRQAVSLFRKEAAKTRIDERFAALRNEGRAGLVTFITAGDPDPATSLAILRSLPAAGADLIELGMPFSDPMADGPTIQASSQRALKAGQTLKKTLAMVRTFRAGDAVTPIVL